MPDVPGPEQLEGLDLEGILRQASPTECRGEVVRLTRKDGVIGGGKGGGPMRIVIETPDEKPVSFRFPGPLALQLLAGAGLQMKPSGNYLNQPGLLPGAL